MQLLQVRQRAAAAAADHQRLHIVLREHAHLGLRVARDQARAGLQLAQHQPQQRRLALPIRAHQRHPCALLTQRAQPLSAFSDHPKKWAYVQTCSMHMVTLASNHFLFAVAKPLPAGCGSAAGEPWSEADCPAGAAGGYA